MAFSKVILDNTTLIDLTQDTVAANNLTAQNTAHNSAGVQVTGSLSVGTKSITENGTYNASSDNYYGYSQVTVAVPPSSATLGTKSITQNGTYEAQDDSLDGYSEVTVAVPSSSPTLQIKSATPTESAQTIEPDSGYDGLSSVSVGAISSSYVGSGITRRSSSDLIFNDDDDGGPNVVVPSGYYANQSVKDIPMGTQGAPTITKSAVSNHSMTIYSYVTNTEGYILGGIKTAPNTTVNASELVSGSETKTVNGTYDVTNLASLVVDVPTGTARSSSDLTVSGATVTAPAGLYSSNASASVASGTEGTPTATKGTVSNHSISVTPSVTNSAGYISGGTHSGTAVTVSASELVSGSETKTANGTYDVTNLSSLVVALSFSTITVSTSDPSGGSDGDIWIKTAS